MANETRPPNTPSSPTSPIEMPPAGEPKPSGPEQNPPRKGGEAPDPRKSDVGRTDDVPREVTGQEPQGGSGVVVGR